MKDASAQKVKWPKGDGQSKEGSLPLSHMITCSATIHLYSSLTEFLGRTTCLPHCYSNAVAMATKVNLNNSFVFNCIESISGMEVP